MKHGVSLILLAFTIHSRHWHVIRKRDTARPEQKNARLHLKKTGRFTAKDEKHRQWAAELLHAPSGQDAINLSIFSFVSPIPSS